MVNEVDADVRDAGESDGHKKEDAGYQRPGPADYPHLLEPSRLGTKSYWDKLYATERDALAARSTSAITATGRKQGRDGGGGPKDKRETIDEDYGNLGGAMVGDDATEERTLGDEQEREDDVYDTGADDDDINTSDSSEGDREEDEDGVSTNWFAEYNASAKIVSYLERLVQPGASSPPASAAVPIPTSAEDNSGSRSTERRIPASLPVLNRATTSFLDLGTGNGHLLLELRERGGFRGTMVGVDYSEGSVALARMILATKKNRVARRQGSGYSVEKEQIFEGQQQQQRRDYRETGLYDNIRFEQWDILNGHDGDGRDDGLRQPHQYDWFPAGQKRTKSNGGCSDPLGRAATDSNHAGDQFAGAGGSCGVVEGGSEEEEDNDDDDGDDESGCGFDVVLDKGTFDAVSLDPANHLHQRPSSSHHSYDPHKVDDGPPLVHNDQHRDQQHDGSGNSRKVEEEGRKRGIWQRTPCEMYAARVLPLMKKRTGLLIVTSCNWTEDELRAWFCGGDGGSGGGDNGADGKVDNRTDIVTASPPLEVVDRIAYPSFTFGGVKGQSISSVVFLRRR